MAKPRKESQPLSIRMEQNLHDRLTLFCDRSGQSKTTAMERALTQYIDEYDYIMQKIDRSKD